MKNDADNKQMVFILLITLTAVTTIGLPQAMAAAAGTGSWITLILSSFIYAFGAWMIVSLNRKFQGEVLFDYSKRLVGNFGAHALGVYYMLYFLVVSAYLCASMSNVLVSNFFVRTPRWAMVFISLPFYAYTAYKGITSIGRLCEIYGALYFLVTGAAFVVMFLQGDKNHILPLFVKEDAYSYIQAMPQTAQAFLGIEVLTFIPIARKGRKKAPWVAFLAVVGIGLFYVMNVESCMMMSGFREIKNQNNALISAIRQIQIPGLSFFERMDFIYLTVGFMGLFAAKTIVLLAAVEYGCKLFPKVKRLIIVIVATLIVFSMSLTLFSVENLWRAYDFIFLYLGNIGALLLPAVFHLIAKVKPNVAQTV